MNVEKLIETRYGFKWGPCEIERTASHMGHVILTIKTERKTLQIRVTPTGFIRFENEQKREPKQ